MKDHEFTQAEPKDAPHLLRDLFDHGTRLVRDEVELAKREVSHKVSRAGAGLVMMGVAVILLLTALDVIAAAAVAAIAEAGLPVSLASVIVGGAAVVIAAILFMVGKSRLNPKHLTPERSIAQVRRDIKTIKETAHV